MLTGITIVCFSASYAVTLGLEISRLFFRVPVRVPLLRGSMSGDTARMVLMLLFAAAGLAAHTLYLYNRATAPQLASVPLSNWHDWYLIAAWILAAVYLIFAVSRLQTSIGLFLQPVVLILVGVGYSFPQNLALPRKQAQNVWGATHGIMLLLGTVAVSLGFVAGLMYLVQSYRLKQKLPPRQGFKLPSLEWLQKVNKQSLVLSSFLIALGMLAGIILNLVKQQGKLPWSDPIVTMSGVLLVWLVAATIFEWTYKPAQQGRKVAYLTVVSFVILALVMGLLVLGSSEHTRAAGIAPGSNQPTSEPANQQLPETHP